MGEDLSSSVLGAYPGCPSSVGGGRQVSSTQHGPFVGLRKHAFSAAALAFWTRPPHLKIKRAPVVLEGFGSWPGADVYNLLKGPKNNVVVFPSTGLF